MKTKQLATAPSSPLQQLPGPTDALLKRVARLLEQPQLFEAHATLVQLAEAVMMLAIGNQTLDRRHHEARLEAQRLHHVLAAVITQSGGRLEVDEKVWQRTSPHNRISGKVTADRSHTVYETTKKPLLTHRLGPEFESYFDGLVRSQLLPAVPRSREIAMTTHEEPYYLPIFDVTDYVDDGKAMS